MVLLWILLIIVIIHYRELVGLIAISVYNLVFGSARESNYVGSAENSIILYHVYADNISTDSDNKFREDAIKIISEGWGTRYKLKHVDDPETANITMELKRSRELDQYHDQKEYYPGTKKEIRFSLTFQSRGGNPYIYIDYNNWKYGIPESELSLMQYRKYVVLHEFGHGLGFDHQECTNALLENGRCPVMFQSTRGCGNYQCGFNITKNDTTSKINGRNTYISNIVDRQPMILID